MPDSTPGSQTALSDVLVEGRPIPIPPAQLRFMNPDPATFVPGGERHAGYLRERGLTDGASLLDIGSGYGRLPVGLLATDFRGTYRGFDILRRHVRWCRQHLMPFDPDRYDFRHFDVLNSRYNPRGTILAHEARFPTRSANHDFAVAFSVFTHMFEADIRHYLAEIRRVLEPGGRALTTWFVFSPSRLAAAADPERTRFPMRHVINDVARYSEPKDPLRAIGYLEDHVRSMITDAGLEVVSVEHGSWCGDEADHGQDFVMVRRPDRRRRPRR